MSKVSDDPSLEPISGLFFLLLLIWWFYDFILIFRGKYYLENKYDDDDLNETVNNQGDNGLTNPVVTKSMLVESRGKVLDKQISTLPNDGQVTKNSESIDENTTKKLEDKYNKLKDEGKLNGSLYGSSKSSMYPRWMFMGVIILAPFILIYQFTMDPEERKEYMKKIDESNQKQPKGVISKFIEKSRKDLDWPDSSGKRLND